MSGRIKARVWALEKAAASKPRTSHRLTWKPDESFDDLLDRYGRDRIRRGDDIFIYRCAEAGRANPLHDRDMPKMEAFLANIEGRR